MDVELKADLLYVAVNGAGIDWLKVGRDVAQQHDVEALPQ